MSPPRAPDAPPRPVVDQTVVAFTPGAPIIVPVSLNGTSVRLVVDTGADRTIISSAAAERAGLGDPQGPPVRVFGVTGTASAGQVVVPTLDLAGARLGNFTVIVLDSSIPNADGLLGRDVLDAFTLTVDAAQGRAFIVPR